MIWKNMIVVPTAADLAWAAWCEEVERIQNEWFRKRNAELFEVLTGEKMVIERRRPIGPIEVAPRGRYHTRNGYPVTILAVGINGPKDITGKPDTVVGIAHRDDRDSVYLWKDDGAFFGDKPHYNDLFELVEVSEEETYYVNHYGGGNFGEGYRSHTDAKRCQCPQGSATILVVTVPGPVSVILPNCKAHYDIIRLLAEEED